MRKYGVNFLHTHPQLEKDAGLNKEHVIVDKSDLEETIALIERLEAMDRMKTYTYKNAEQTTLSKLADISEARQRDTKVLDSIGLALLFGDLIRPVTKQQKNNGFRIMHFNVDLTEKTISAIKNLGLKYEVGNDAPKGGALGTYIKLLP